jgi:hypothetical protein
VSYLSSSSSGNSDSTSARYCSDCNHLNNLFICTLLLEYTTNVPTFSMEIGVIPICWLHCYAIHWIWCAVTEDSLSDIPAYSYHHPNRNIHSSCLIGINHCTTGFSAKKVTGGWLTIGHHRYFPGIFGLLCKSELFHFVPYLAQPLEQNVLLEVMVTWGR